jgi:hypothetical protein
MPICTRALSTHTHHHRLIESSFVQVTPISSALPLTSKDFAGFLYKPCLLVEVSNNASLNKLEQQTIST